MKHNIVFMYLLLCLGIGLQAANFKLPIEEKQYQALTSYTELSETLHQLQKRSGAFQLETIGHSVKGRDLYALIFSKSKIARPEERQRPLVLIYCQQHGDEPSGKEAALLLARELAFNDNDILKKLDLILVPQVNPDGSEMNRRRNANGMDLNRNHAILSEPESQALHNLFLKYLPEVTLDVHEYNAIKKDWIEHGIIKDAAEMMGGPTNLNVAEELRNLAANTVIPNVGKKVESRGFTFSRYVVGKPFNKERLRFSTTNINDGRQSMAIYNTLSFIIEGKRYGAVDNEIKRRVEGQFAALHAFLETIAEQSKQILKTVKAARKKPLSERVAIQMDYFKDPQMDSLLFPVFDLFKWKTVKKKLSPFHGRVLVKKSVKRPKGYLFSGELTKLIEVLKRHRIKFTVLSEEQKFTVESYKILHVVPGIDEDKPTLSVDVEKRQESKIFKKGNIFVPMNQPAANLIPLLLEPQSTYNLFQERNGRRYALKSFLKVGSEFPIYQVIK